MTIFCLDGEYPVTEFLRMQFLFFFCELDSGIAWGHWKAIPLNLKKWCNLFVSAPSISLSTSLLHPLHLPPPPSPPPYLCSLYAIGHHKSFTKREPREVKIFEIP